MRPGQVERRLTIDVADKGHQAFFELVFGRQYGGDVVRFRSARRGERERLRAMSIFRCRGQLAEHPGANANIVPVVANGRVYVASYKQLVIELESTSSQPEQTDVQDATELGPNERVIFGTISTVNGDTLAVANPSGALVNVDATEAVEAHQSAVLSADEPVRIIGSYDTSSIERTSR
jgi:hypothetical protein